MTSKFRRLVVQFTRAAVWSAVVAAALLAAPALTFAQTTTIIGSLANFDAVNDTEGEKSGFEIQLEGIQVNDITRVFGQNGAQCWIRYCIGSITPYTDAATGKSGVYVRWMANYDSANHRFVVPAQNANAGSTTSGTPSRVGMNNPPRLVSGEQCWTLGLAANYPSSGCEHFGISTAFGKTPTKTVYRWLVGDPLTGIVAPATINVQVPGVPAPVAVQAPPVAIGQPVALPPVIKNGVVQLDVVMPAQPIVPDPALPGVPPPPAPRRYGKAQWVKVYKTELGRDAGLDELVGGHPNHVIEDAEAGPVETEWKLLQMDVTNPDNGSSQLTNSGKHGSGKRAVVRRYEFYKYTGPVIAPGTRADKQGTAYLGDDGELSTCVRSNGECVGPPQILDPALFSDNDYVDPKTGFHYAEVGDYAGAQMAAENLVDNRLVPSLNWSPAPLAYGAALGAAQLTATASATGHPSVPGTFEFTPAPGTVLPAGTHTLQVLFTPADGATYTTQSMTRQITISKAILTVKANPQTKVYGQPDPAFTFTATGFVNGDTEATALSGALDREIGSNVGKYAINIGTLTTSSNYTGLFTGALLEITAAPLSITANDATKIYGQTTTFAGTEFTVGAGQLQGLDAVTSVSLTSAGAAAAAPVGSSPIVASAAVGSGLGNYTIGYADGTLTVTKADSTVTVSCPASVTFTGAAQTPCTASATGVGMAAVDVTASLIYASNTDAGAATVSASWAGDANHADSTGTGGFAIAKADSTVTVSCPASVTFTGAAQTPCTASATGVGMAAVDVTASLLYASNTNAGAATVSANWAGDANHAGSSSAGGFAIARADSTVTVTCPASITFTGAAQTPCTASATGAGMAAVDVTASLIYASNINAGAAAASATFAGDANHAGSSGAGGFAIAPAASAVTVSCPASATFTGAAIEPCTAAVSGAGGLSGSLTPVYSNNVNAGTATATASYAGDGNHLASSNSATFTIVGAPASGITIAPIANRSDRLGAEVEFRVVVTGAGRGGRFSASGLPNGIRIDDEGEIHGHVGGPAGSNNVTVSFTQNGVTVSTSFVWQVTRPAPGRDDRDDRDDREDKGKDR